MVAIFSQNIERLILSLLQHLYSEGAPFAKRVVVVPHPSFKSYLLEKIALQPSMRVAAGIEVITLKEALSLLLVKRSPDFLELSLAIQHEIRGLLQEKKEAFSSLFAYLDAPSYSLREAQLSDLLSATFLEYGEYGGKFLEEWSKTSDFCAEIWRRLFSPNSPWTFPYQTMETSMQLPFRLHLFGFHFLPPLYLHLFKKVEAFFYLFSPCSYFWADQLSIKEQLRAKMNGQMEENPLLSNFGKLGRKFFTSILDQDLEIEESYIEVEGKSLLGAVQKSILEGAPLEFRQDNSIELLSASSLFREVQILYEKLLLLLESKQMEPQDILVLAPDISDYAPYIKTVFSALDYSISGLEQRHTSCLVQSFEQLILLPEKKFSKEAILTLFSHLPFREKFQLTQEELSTIERWLDDVKVRWGMDKAQREELLLESVEDGDAGTWENGIKLLIRRMAYAEDSSKNSPVHFSDAELFNKLIKILLSLKEDLEPLFTNVTMLIPSWISYFQYLLDSYFSSHEEGLAKELSSLSKSLAHLNVHPVDFSSIRRILSSIFGKKNGGYQLTCLHGVKFRSLIAGAPCSSKVIYLLGMQEGEFPRKNRKKMAENEFQTLGDYHPTQVDEDRYLFLQLLLSAESRFIISYQRLSSDDQKPLRPSLLVQELATYLHLKESPQTLKLSSLAHKPIFSPLIPEFYAPSDLKRKEEDLVIEMEQLAKFAKHPLRFYFHSILKMDIPSFYNNEEEEEFLLSPLMKKNLRDKALKNDLSSLLQEVEAKGEMPRGLFKKIAIQSMRTTLLDLEVQMETFKISKEEIFSFDVEIKVGMPGGYSAAISGKLHNCTSKGLLFYGEDCLEDLVKVWPLFLIYLHSFKEAPQCILFTKTAEVKQFYIEDPLILLQRYLEYYQLSCQTPSPLIPPFAEPLLKGGEADLEKEIAKIGASQFGIQDEILSWLIARDGALSGSAIHQNWSPILRRVYALL